MLSEAMSNWIQTLIDSLGLSESTTDYLYARGTKDETIMGERIKSWDPSVLKKVQSPPDFSNKILYRESVIPPDSIMFPYWSPRGDPIGVMFRSIQTKDFFDYRIPDSGHHPFFLGLRMGFESVWSGGDVWITEGFFDKTAIEWVVPPTDAVLSTSRARLSPVHVEFLRRYCKGWVHVVYDMDETGKKAANGWTDQITGKRRFGATELLTKAGVKNRSITFSGGKDPGQIWDNGGAVAVRSVFSKFV